MSADNKALEEKMRAEVGRQTLFEGIANDILDNPSGYRRVEVLLIRWDESIDDFPGHGEEIDRLQAIFINRFKYGCRVARIMNLRNSQVELCSAIMDHVKYYDDERTLLIVYYTGHGGRVPIQDDTGLRHDLRLFAKEQGHKIGPGMASASWDDAEKVLLEWASADILAILDCCFASTAATKADNDTTRAYYLLAASGSEDATNEPGPKSFTTALCDSLEELLDESNGELFPLTSLQQRINTKPEQNSFSWDRINRHKKTFGKIKLGRLQADPPGNAPVQKGPLGKASLTLRVSLQKEDIDHEQIRKLGESLPFAYKEAGMQPCRMYWLKYEKYSELSRGRMSQFHRMPGGYIDTSESEREATRQAIFEKSTNRGLNLPHGYSKVAVLIIRWDASIDDFAGHTGEIQGLRAIFEEQFGYICTLHSIKNLKKPQVDLNRAILDHIHEHDDPNNLLIFYYTGHGIQRKDDLELSANQHLNTEGVHLPKASWNSAEDPIRNFMDGDALSILDCCMASSAAMKSGNPSPRTYQLLAASAADAPTCGPGENSFTAALCSSLTELLKEADGGTFPLSQLCERINTKRTLQACLPWDRLRKFNRNVRLGRIEKSANIEKPFIDENPEQSSLFLRLSFKASDLDDDQIQRLAERLPAACRQAQVPLRRIDWHRMAPTEPPATAPSIRFTDPCPSLTDDGIPSDEIFDADTNDGIDTRPRDFQIAVTAVDAAQRWRSRAKRNHGSHCQVSEDRNITSPRVQRDVKLSLALCGAIVVFMLMYGPRGAITSGRYVRR